MSCGNRSEVAMYVCMNAGENRVSFNLRPQTLQHICFAVRSVFRPDFRSGVVMRKGETPDCLRLVIVESEGEDDDDGREKNL